MTPTGHGLAATGDAAAFLGRLTRLDPAALVRLRATPRADLTALWAPLPWRVLVTRTVDGPGPRPAAGSGVDATVRAAELAAALAAGRPELPDRWDARWRWPLPSRPAGVLERVPAGRVRAAADAAAATLRQARGQRPVGDRVLRDALLDHVAITVVPGPEVGRTGDPANAPVAVPQRLVQAVVRMGFLGALNTGGERSVDVCVSGTWIGLAAPYGTAWLPRSGGFTLIT